MTGDTASPLQGHPDEAVTQALGLLGKRRLALAIHDSCFPAATGHDVGRGSPYGQAARDFLAFARRLGFDTVQFGPQGQTGRGDPSPYLGTLFSKNVLNLDLASLAAAPGTGELAGLLEGEELAALAAGCPCSDGMRSEHAYAYDASHRALAAMQRGLAAGCRRGDPRALELAAAVAEFSARQDHWLQADALYHALAERHGGRHHRHWTAAGAGCPDRDLYRPAAADPGDCRARRDELAAVHEEPMARYRLGQYLLQRQHALQKAALHALGLRLYGDLQVGMSACDQWSRGDCYLPDYLLGAPPSRTNPAGQPWGYGVLDPGQYLTRDGDAGPVLRSLLARLERMLDDFDGLRIDHPHGLVCPWVYRADDPDPYHAVQNGARLFSAPDLPDHPALAPYAIPRPHQLNRGVARHADDWVDHLEPDQVARYGLLLDTLVGAVRGRGGSSEDILCEVLSTLPRPLARVIERQGLGRFRVTQKADVADPADPYRGDNARPEDWVMAGNHDTPPLWQVVRRWQQEGEVPRQADYLAARLVPEEERADFAASLARDHRKLVHAKMAAAFVSPAAQVMVFFPDLLGLEASYNRAGMVHPDNWTVRVAPDYAAAYQRAVACGEALNLPCVLALALRGRSPALATLHRDLMGRLWRQAGWWEES